MNEMKLDILKAAEILFDTVENAETGNIISFIQ